MNTTTTSSLTDLLETRRTVGRFIPDRPLPEGVVEKLIHLATRAPTAFNLQNWRFIAVESDAAKERLQAVAYGQPQVRDASVTFIVCGQTEAYRHLFARLQPAVDAGMIPSAVQQGWSDMATASHENNPQLQRDEAFRSASLAAMTLMLAANELGYASGALSGFDPAALAEAFELPAHNIPVMLVTVGHAAERNWQQKPRRPLSEVLERV
ncbi:nitroreductase family protein [Actomonas aquatica]|uniref:Nitroreductase family protein n=1 Tax=Actomonas aquatica TaxID=2866162 RepID=A0ABZ1C895_9BACT|nr:nitroreductase family protein [Opitutus sp. WL0086]WRQ87814.1 nitroreductase family protein [Opitutus sp. WL0086]